MYDQKVAGAFIGLGKAADQLASLVDDAKNTKNGAVYQLVYGDARGIVNDLAQAAGDLKRITTKVSAGEGSLGGSSMIQRCTTTSRRSSAT